MSEKIHNSTFKVKILASSIEPSFFKLDAEKEPRYYTYFSIEFEKWIA